ncbi:MAG TPA: amino acid adenylation domain-containing protein, partial [Thermoanaerobaculia bacterium]|nr:amino acid adenylation domain-containing protein [Thermoanaerobaculia bacterium]
LDLPFDRLIEALQPERTPNRTPFFQVVVNQRDNPLAGLGLPGCEMEVLADVHDGNSPFDLTLEMGVEHDGRQLLFFEYSTDLFDAPTIDRLLGHYGNLLAAAVESPGRPMHALPLLAREESRQLLSGGGAGSPLEPATGPLFHERLEAWAAETPEATAVIYRDEAAGVETALTWRELQGRAWGVAAALRAAGVAPEVPVAVFVERSAELAVAFLGVLASGGAYLPLDPALPPGRLAFLLADAGAPVVLTTRSRLADLTAVFAPGLPLPRPLFLEETAAAAAAPPGPPALPEDLAYIIYTSGSTGRPKGVQVTHRGLRFFARSVFDAFGIGAGHRVLQLSSPAFDASILEMAMAWTGGGTLCLAPREDLLPGPGLLARLDGWGITHLAISPSALATLEEAPLPALEAVVAIAEAFSGELVERWGKGRSFFNAYGPTEATVWASVARCRSGAVKPPIGRPVAGARLMVADRAGLLLPAGVPGELLVGGEGVARGYRGRPDLTAERFVPDPWAGVAGARVYRTGDLVRWLPGGELEFLGRVDFQVKIRGHRIEPGEIEAALEEHPAVRRAAVKPCRTAGGEVFLAAWVAADADPAVLREHLRSRLPAAMVPAVLRCLDALPLTASGKVDRKALPAPEWAAPAAVYTPPQTAEEERLAALWRQLLDRERVGIDDNFFDLGGHSLLLVRMHTALRQDF